jgi:hypothetical protein
MTTRDLARELKDVQIIPQGVTRNDLAAANALLGLGRGTRGGA